MSDTLFVFPEMIKRRETDRSGGGLPRMQISVILAAYRGEKFIGEQLESLFAQTCPPDEILIGDDSPDDATFQLVRRLAENSPCPIRYFRNAERKGHNLNFSSLLERANGDVIFFCDQDDVWLPEKIEKMRNEFLNHPECEMVSCNSLLVDENLKPLGFSSCDIFSFRESDAEKINAGNGVLDMLKNSKIHGHDLAVRNKLKRYLVPIPFGGHYDCMVALIAAVTGNVRWVYENLTLFRRHPGAQTRQGPSKNIIQRYLDLKRSGTHRVELKDAAEQMRIVKKRVSKFKSEIPGDHYHLLEEMTRYYMKRACLARMNLWNKWRCLFLLKEYFQYGQGCKSLIRDLLF